ncbi:transcriptional regulator with XRE-family HTH domain [Catenuloplanes nepalensis]|uniref:Transcriptional regulator with XRE-family HTH domain n=1 Tax=Catenuloplanes nepalensis TaxID=587533 RepID=A0ABT9MK59_9ACTN|nr:helix-turn-helix transcriptional regulator [Catenuloplanes nepalensis]MDP9791810.1 transcriptional regulator with XRE-family HTH domain [Catenuloplanes nepalensis]
MPLLRRIIGSVLRRLRLAQGRTLQDVARDADVSLPYLSEIERGRKEASSEILAAICRALGIGLGDLLDEARRELARTDPRRISPRAAAGLAPHATSGSVPHATAGTAPHTTAGSVPRVLASARGSAGAPRSAARLCGGNAGRLRVTVALEAILRSGETFEGAAVSAAR